jgi:hypothetical protein
MQRRFYSGNSASVKSQQRSSYPLHPRKAAGVLFESRQGIGRGMTFGNSTGEIGVEKERNAAYSVCARPVPNRLPTAAPESSNRPVTRL